MGVNIKQAKYSGTHQDDDPHMPTSGEPQPVLDTSNNSGVGPGVRFVQAHYSGIRGNPDLAPDVPSGAYIPTGSTDVQNPESHGSDVSPPDIFKGAPNTSRPEDLR